jgi:hypothetical protein
MGQWDGTDMVKHAKTDWTSERLMAKAAAGNGLQRPEDAWVTLDEDAETAYGTGHVYVRRISPDNPEYTVAQIRPGMRAKIYGGLCVSIQRITPTEQMVEWEVVDRGTGSFVQYGGTTPPESIAVHSHQTEAEGGLLDGSVIATGTVEDARLSANVMLLDGVQTNTGAKTFGSGDLIATDADLNTPDIDGGTITGATELTVVSTSSGSIPMPVMTETQRDAIASPVEGMWVFNSDTSAPNYYDGADWQAVASASLTSPVGIADGGTGQTSATAAFDALAPASPTKGDMLVHNGTNWIKHDGGSDGQFITYDSAEASGIKNVTLTPSDLGTLIVTTETMRKVVSLVDTTLGSNGAFDESSIDQTYDHLEGELFVRGSVSAVSDLLILWLNNDTTAANYHSQRHAVDNAAVDNSESNNSSIAAQIVGDTAFTDSWSYIKFYIPFYTNSKTKHVRLEGQSYKSADTTWFGVAIVNWESTAAINRIMFRTDNHATDLFLTGSRLRIWGVKNGAVVTNVELV